MHIHQIHLFVPAKANPGESSFADFDFDRRIWTNSLRVLSVNKLADLMLAGHDLIRDVFTTRR
jgi:hypothetical protein